MKYRVYDRQEHQSREIEERIYKPSEIEVIQKIKYELAKEGRRYKLLEINKIEAAKDA